MEKQKREMRAFALVTGAAIVLLFGLLFPLLGGRPWPMWPWLVATGLYFASLICPRCLMPVHKLWMRLGHVLGYINSRIILSVVFFLLIVPFGLLLRVIGKRPVPTRFDPAGRYL